MKYSDFRDQQTQKVFSILFDSSPIGMALGDIEGNLLLVNKAFEDFIGYSEQELLEKSYHLITHPEDIIESQEKYKQMVTGQCDHYQLEKRYFHKSGQILWGELDVSLVRDSQGEPSYTIGQVKDITAKKRVEQENAFQQQRLKALWGVARLAGEDLQEICNHILEEIVGMTQSQYGFYGFLNDSEDTMTIFSWSKEAMDDCEMQDKPLVFDIDKSGIWANAVRSRKPFILNDYQGGCENKKGIPEGHVPITKVLSVPVIISDKIVAVGAVANKSEDYSEEDIAQLKAFLSNVQILIDRKNIENELVEKEERYRRLYEDTPIMMHSVDKDGILINVSNHWLKTMGYDRDEVIGCHFSKFLTAESSNHAQRVVFPKFLSDGVLSNTQYNFVKKCGDVMQTLLSAIAEYDENNQFMRSLAVIVDVTERNKLFEEQTRSGQLAVLGTVAAGVAHEINNPINGIMNYADLLVNYADNKDRVLNIASKISKESKRISGITSDLLNYSKDNREEKIKVDIVKIIESALSIVEIKFVKLGIRLKTDFIKGLPKVSVNPQNIQQVIINLVDNACYAVLKNERGIDGIVTVKCAMDDKDPKMICLEVLDNGIGMSESTIRNAKNAFFTTKPLQEGTGLGLSIVNEIVNKHDGRLEIESQEGEFTKIKILLPLN